MLTNSWLTPNKSFKNLHILEFCSERYIHPLQTTKFIPDNEYANFNSGMFAVVCDGLKFSYNLTEAKEH